ncbi:O-antigen ligase [mine drainage metagenome]|uniref:O-antigen ligase n=1 Tax=mine drainage metagenome TaxID=410659 RepID=A0A1J5RCV2_9ZZZZ
MSAFIFAWGFSAVISLAAYRALRTGRIRSLLALALATVWFPAQFGELLHSPNSVFFPLDLAVAFAGVLFLQRKLSFRHPGFDARPLLVAAGVWPFLGSFLFATSSTQIAICLINLYRLAGTLMLYEVVVDECGGIDFRTMVEIGFRVTLLMLVTMALQGVGAIDTNIFDYAKNFDPLEYLRLVVDDPDFKFIVLGYFKAAQGIVFMVLLALGLAAYTQKGRYWFIRGGLITFGASVGLVLTGSKTSLVAAGAIMVAAWLSSQRRYRLAVPLVALALGVVGFVGYVLTSPDASDYVNSTLYEYVKSGGSDVTTLNYRETRYQESLDTLLEHPLVLAGIYDERFPLYSVDYFHSEYLSILMLGGVVSVYLYLKFLLSLARALYARRRDSPFAMAAWLALIGNAVQGLTVNQLEPGFVFVQSVAFSLFVYRMALAERRGA